ncbi:hypothetical protein MMC14_003903 [Varicellaria rhodocarpa]|nr:hypothetical protein [Varicellaria rhodocarpa]
MPLEDPLEDRVNESSVAEANDDNEKAVKGHWTSSKGAEDKRMAENKREQAASSPSNLRIPDLKVETGILSAY